MTATLSSHNVLISQQPARLAAIESMQNKGVNVA